MSIDHYLQSRIVDELRVQERTFSELRPDGIENSLFMYHLRKLITRGIVEKIDKTYQLTPEGARWAHKLDASYRTVVGLRMLVQLFIVSDGNLLVSERQGAAAIHMNHFLLPSTLHEFGKTGQQCADVLAQHLNVTRGVLLTQVETIMPSQQLHSISDIYEGMSRDEALPSAEEGYTYTWIDLQKVAQMDSREAGALPMVAQKFLSGTLSAREYNLEN